MITSVALRALQNALAAASSEGRIMDSLDLGAHLIQQNGAARDLATELGLLPRAHGEIHSQRTITFERATSRFISDCVGQSLEGLSMQTDRTVTTYDLLMALLENRHCALARVEILSSRLDELRSQEARIHARRDEIANYPADTVKANSASFNESVETVIGEMEP
jgi:hypothetical protein